MKRVPARNHIASAAIGQIGIPLLSAALYGPALACASAVGPSSIPSPWAVASPGPNNIGARLTFDAAFFDRIVGQRSIRMAGFPLGVFERVDLDLRRVEPFSRDAWIVVRNLSGDVPVAPPDLICLAGRIAGEPDSSVTIGVARAGPLTIVNGLVQRATSRDPKTYVLSSGPVASSGGIVIFNAEGVPADWLSLLPLRCSPDVMALTAPPTSPPGGVPRGDPPCRLATIAIDTDQEYLLDRFAGNTSAAAAYAGTLVAAVSEIYQRDFNARLQIGFLRLWETEDPWDQSDAYQQIYQFRDYWNEFMYDVPRNAVHFLTARTLDQANGLAYLNGLCAFQFDYSMASQINGFFPYPIQDNHPQNWDLFMVAHELGHNFGAPHTHSMSPPVDSCNTGDCSVAPNGTIMSFCYQCPGGMSDVLMQFHPRSVQEGVLPFLGSGALCDITMHVQISQQPVSHDGCPGNLFNLSVAAAGSGSLSYQWRRNGVPIVGATSPTFSIVSFWPPQAGVFDVVVSDQCSSITSEPANVGVCGGVVGDLNLNCHVDIGDLTVFLTRFGRDGNPLADFDGDGDVDVSDLSVILGSFGANGCN